MPDPPLPKRLFVTSPLEYRYVLIILLSVSAHVIIFPVPLFIKTPNVEPTRVFRRQFILSHATLADSSNWR